ncbi:caspase family protein [uncultured Ruegeria sp.]|uniref:caspase family protein n=1 Tax=uncultured Ruegeria sp. TaxID=259304 RepID=UPI00262C28F3|nr:caspase family protein [uncultured Ruegeria sp.]
MTRRALLVGINEYDDPGVQNLSGCVRDVEGMLEVLSRHWDGRPNYQCRQFVSPGHTGVISRGLLRDQLSELFNFDGDVLFYFSGHGSLTQVGGFLVTQDAAQGDPGIHMDELVALANKSNARNILIIVDCCFSGNIGILAGLDVQDRPMAQIREGVTMLAASQKHEPSFENTGGQGIFTELVIGALKGGAANVRGKVSAAAVYGYVEAALGAWSQSPIYKSHAKNLDAIRECDPVIADSLIRELPDHFPSEDFALMLDPTFEETNLSVAVPENVEIFKKMKQYQIAGLVKNRSGRDLYWTAEQSGCVQLTPLGQFYRRLATESLI